MTPSPATPTPPSPPPAVPKTKTSSSLPAPTLALSWSEEEIENRFGFFHAGRYTTINKTLSLVIAIILTAIFYFLNTIALNHIPAAHRLAIIFLRPANIYTVGPAVVLFFWAITALYLKSRKLDFQKRALKLAAVPQQPDFVLNEATARTVLERLHSLVDNPRHFILLNRIERALSNLHNIGGIGEVSEILRAQAENDENQIASSYTMVSGVVWAIPVLGFIGTVQGLSLAVGNFGRTVQAGGEVSRLKDSLIGVTGGLSTAFETTLVGLVAALIIQLYLSFLQQREAEFLDECNDYCHSHVISKLRLKK
jgi:biopolymer transport protein ExbB/TolQ